jgi:hypothetical protein
MIPAVAADQVVLSYTVAVKEKYAVGLEPKISNTSIASFTGSEGPL